MAEDENNCKGLKVLDPVSGLIDYILDVKPFHSKIVEVLVEYIYDEATDITIGENWLTNIEITKPDQDLIFTACLGGYSLIPYGGLRGWPVISPNQRIAFEDYPAIDNTTRKITIPGDRSQDVRPGQQFELISFLDNMEPLCAIVDIGPQHFIIEDTSIYAVPFTTALGAYTGPLQTTGMPLDDGKFFDVTAVLPNNPSAGFVRVEVKQFILNPVPIGHFGLIRNLGNHTGLYTVEDITYREGSNDIWTDPLDPYSRLVGDDPHTIITTVETLNALPTIGARENYSVNFRLTPIAIEQVLSYSHFTGLPTNTPDEGYLIRDILAANPSTLDGFGVAIPGTGSITIVGNLSESNIFEGDQVRIYNSTDNNGLFNITSMTYDGIEDETTLFVVERIRTDTADGNARIDIPSNVFFVDGDYSSRFSQGAEFNVVGGSYQGRYMTLTSDYVGNKTRIRPAQDIIKPGAGIDIIDIPSTNILVVDRNKTHIFKVGFKLNIVGSSVNDGVYEILNVNYNAISDDTELTLVEDLELIIDGQVFESFLGYIKDHSYGFADGREFCAYNPETLIKTKFIEDFKVEGLTLDLHSHLIVYNMENTDSWGFETPISTNYSATAPVVTEQATAPGSPSLNEFWFNTDTGILHYWSVNGTWIPTKTVYWLNMLTNLFHYRTMYDRQEYDYDTKTLGSKVRVDTDWTQLFANPPGFNDIQPAVPPTFNAHVATFDYDTNRKTHNDVYTTPAHTDQSYTIPGGNFVQRMGPETRLELYDYDSVTPFLDFDYPKSFVIQSIGATTITIPGIYDWFFEADTILGVRIWNETYHEMVIVGSTAGAGMTDIEVSAADIAKFQGLTVEFGTVLGAVFDPRPNWTFPNDQRKTYVLPEGGLTYPEIDSIIYNFVEPQRVHTLTTDATIKENFKIDWGSTYAWQIVDTSSGGSNITVTGDIKSFLDKTNKLFITNSEGNDGEYEIDAIFLLGGPPIQTVVTLTPSLPVDPDPGHMGFLQLEDSEVVDWFQFTIVSANSTTNEFIVNGDATVDIPNGGDFRVVGTSNDGTYTATSTPVYNGGLDQTTIQVANISNNDTGGWIEHV